jgi:RNA polymerase sigma-70 factor (ECF subfamily)
MKISYEFITGEIVEIEVPENIKNVSIEIDRDIYNIDRKETRRHNSLDYMEDAGLQFEDNSVDVVLDLEQKEVMDEINNALDILLPEQKELVEKVFYKNIKIADIAAASGVTEAAIRNRLKKIYKKLKKVLI